MEKYSDDTPIKDLPLSFGAKNVLKKYVVSTNPYKYATVFGEIKELTPKELSNLRGMGTIKLNEILRFFEEYSGEKTKITELPTSLAVQKLKEQGVKTLYDLKINSYLGRILSSMKIFTLVDLVKSEDILKSRPTIYEQAKHFLNEIGYDFNTVIPLELQYDIDEITTEQLKDDYERKIEELKKLKRELEELESLISFKEEKKVDSKPEINNSNHASTMLKKTR